jgi:Tfp pilus assembly protein PilX
MAMSSPRSRPSHAQRGAATLLVVVVLFFILALVTAYASRNLIFEQRISANNQRSAADGSTKPTALRPTTPRSTPFDSVT